MEEFGVSRFDGIGGAVRKRRTQTSRRSRTDSQQYSESCDRSPLSPTPLSDELSKVSSDENSSDSHSKRKEFNLNQCVSRASSANVHEVEKPYEKTEDREFNASYSSEPRRSGFNNKRSSEGALAPANWKNSRKMKEVTEVYSGKNAESMKIGQSGVNLDESGNDNKVKKVKLKVGGKTRTIQANAMLNGSSVDGSCSKNSQSSDAPRLKQKPNFPANSDDEPSLDKRIGCQGIPWKDFSGGGFRFAKENSVMGKTPGKNASGKQGDRSEPVRKSRRIPKRRVLDGAFNDEDIDDEIRYLEKLKVSKVVGGYRENEEESNKKHRKLSKISDLGNYGASKLVKDGKRKSRSDRVSDDTDYEEEEPASDGELEGKKSQSESVDYELDGKREMTLTTRQRALQSSKDASSAPGSSLIEFPNGLPPAPPRRQKEKLTEVEQQLKKAEAAQRRRLQVEKAARESEAEAIRKILGQDSSRKKREDKIKKRQEELAQERETNAKILRPNTIRTVFSPTGTVVTFHNEMGLPSIFNSKPCSYPPPRESCAGPSCTNPYKYRDSKSKLPLCSLKCYKAIQEKAQAICANR